MKDNVPNDAVEIQLLPAERKLLLEYGYPFESARKQLEAMAQSKAMIETLVISRFYLQRLSADLFRPISKGKVKGKTRQALFDLCERLDYAERWGDGDLDIEW